MRDVVGLKVVCMECCGVYGMLEVVIVSDVYPSLACRIPIHIALLRSESLPVAIGSCRFHHYWHHLLHRKVFIFSN